MKLAGRSSGILALLSACAVMMSCSGGDGAAPLEKKQLVFLSWNLPGYDQNYRQMIAEFETSHPEIQVTLIDKKGTEWPAYFRTALIARSQPDIVDVQGSLWAEYADSGLLLDLTPWLDREPDIAARFFPGALSMWELDGKYYMLPFYFTKSLLIYNKTLFARAALDAPPQSFDELLDFAARLSGDGKTGFITLNMDWIYWSLFALNDIELLTPDLKEVAFDTPEMIAVLRRLAEATGNGHIDKLSWTGRWVEPNSAFAAGNIGMYQTSASALFWTAARADWMNPDTIGISQLPAGLSVPSAHGYGIARTTRHPDAAWEFLKLATSQRWQKRFSDNYSVLTLNTAVDAEMLAALRSQDPLKEAALRETLSNFDSFTANWRSPLDARLQSAFYPPIQAALLGEKVPEEAVAEAALAVGRVLRRVR